MCHRKTTFAMRESRSGKACGQQSLNHEPEFDPPPRLPTMLTGEEREFTEIH